MTAIGSSRYLLSGFHAGITVPLPVVVEWSSDRYSVPVCRHVGQRCMQTFQNIASLVQYLCDLSPFVLRVILKTFHSWSGYMEAACQTIPILIRSRTKPEEVRHFQASVLVVRVDKNRTMGGAFNFDSQKGGALSTMGHLCRGNQPWLGVTDNKGKNCNDHLRVVQRGGANVYFPRTFSSIYLPLWGEKTDSRVVQTLEDSKVWDILSSGLEEGTRISPEKCGTIAELRGVDPEKLLEAAQRRLDGDKAPVDATEEDFRRSEYEALRNARGDQATDLFVEAVEVSKYADWVSEFFEKICLVRKLRETRVLEGFSRLLPVDSDDGPGASGVQPLASKSYIHWLPAMIVRGEGIFFELNSDRINEWIADSDAGARAEKLYAQYNQSRLQRNLSPVEFDARFLLLHTLAHVLIRQLSYDCGYGSAALRERLYCNRTEGSEPMLGILIYTAAGDSEGTMGGLVRQGEPSNLEPTLRAAIRSAKWCSSDPVCIESEGQGIDSANLAACHGCTLLPETSCEEGNRLLDRAMMSGTPTHPRLGLFSDGTDEL